MTEGTSFSEDDRGARLLRMTEGPRLLRMTAGASSNEVHSEASSSEDDRGGLVF